MYGIFGKAWVRESLTVLKKSYSGPKPGDFVMLGDIPGDPEDCSVVGGARGVPDRDRYTSLKEERLFKN